MHKHVCSHACMHNVEIIIFFVENRIQSTILYKFIVYMHAAPYLDFCCYCWLLSLWLINRHWKFLVTYNQTQSFPTWHQLIVYNVFVKDAEYDTIKKVYNYVLVYYHSLCFSVVEVTRYMHLCTFKDRIWDCFSPKNNNDINTIMTFSKHLFSYTPNSVPSFNMWIIKFVYPWWYRAWHSILLILICIHHTLLNVVQYYGNNWYYVTASNDKYNYYHEWSWWALLRMIFTKGF